MGILYLKTGMFIMFELKIETSLKRIMNQSLKWYLKHTCLCYFQYRDGSTLCTVYTIIKKCCCNCEVLNMSNHVKCIWFILLLPGVILIYIYVLNISKWQKKKCLPLFIFADEFKLFVFCENVVELLVQSTCKKII